MTQIEEMLAELRKIERRLARIEGAVCRGVLVAEEDDRAEAGALQPYGGGVSYWPAGDRGVALAQGHRYPPARADPVGVGSEEVTARGRGRWR